MPNEVFPKQKRIKSVSHSDIARTLRSEFPRVFETEKSAKQVVDAVIAQARKMLIQHGRVCLRGIGTLRVSVGGKDPEAAPEEGKVVYRKRISIVTSWLMMDVLNPENPKYVYKPKRPFIRRGSHGK